MIVKGLFTHILLPLIFPLFLLSCAGLPNSEDTSGVSYNQRQINYLKSKLLNVEKNYNESILSTRKKQVDIEATLDKLHIEIQKLQGRMEENTYYTQQILKDQQGFQSDYAQRIMAIERKIYALESWTKFKGSPLFPPQKSVLPQPKETKELKPMPAIPKDSEVPPQKEKVNMDELYSTARALFERENYDVAMEKFSKFLKFFPDTERSDNAQFWIGECYYKQKNYEKAIMAYEELKTKYPHGNKIPDAYLKEGLSFFALNDKKGGAIVLKELIKKYPQSEQAQKARIILEQ
jgi:tol-pal system protein YbgF